MKNREQRGSCWAPSTSGETEPSTLGDRVSDIRCQAEGRFRRVEVRLRFFAEDAKDHVKVGLDYLQLTQRCRAQVAVSSRSVPGRNGGCTGGLSGKHAGGATQTSQSQRQIVRVPAFAA